MPHDNDMDSHTLYVSLHLFQAQVAGGRQPRRAKASSSSTEHVRVHLTLARIACLSSPKPGINSHQMDDDHKTDGGTAAATGEAGSPSEASAATEGATAESPSRGAAEEKQTDADSYVNYGTCSSEMEWLLSGCVSAMDERRGISE